MGRCKQKNRGVKSGMEKNYFEGSVQLRKR